jgi:hypothetical protein
MPDCQQSLNTPTTDRKSQIAAPQEMSLTLPKHLWTPLAPQDAPKDFDDIVKAAVTPVTTKEQFAVVLGKLVQRTAIAFANGTTPWASAGNLLLFKTDGCKILCEHKEAETFVTTGEFLEVNVGKKDRTLIRVEATLVDVMEGTSYIAGRLVRIGASWCIAALMDANNVSLCCSSSKRLI